MDSWDNRFMELCREISEWSEDNSRKVGAIIVGSAHEILSTGYNGLPRGVVYNCERENKSEGEKYHWFEHAERNAIFNAARAGTRVEGATIYSSVFPCADCARAIIQSGITVVKSVPHPLNDPTYKRSFEVSKVMFAEAGVSVELFSSEDCS
jgi:dCMP deaminase